MCKASTSNLFLPDESYAEHKSSQHPIIAMYAEFDARKATLLKDCGRQLYFHLERHVETFEERETLAHMYTCKDRFCPFCNWRRARKLAIQTYEVLDFISKSAKFRFLHLTLTVKNPYIESTRESILSMNSAFQRMFRWKRVKESIVGFVKVLEIHPQKTDFSFTHPHFHVLVVVPTLYFNSNYNLYINQNEWVDLWKKALCADYRPSVSVRVIRPKIQGVDEIASAVAEVCKYPFKSIDFLNYPSSLFMILTEQLVCLRRVSSGGEVKKTRQILNMEDSEDGDLVFENERTSDLWEKISLVMYQYDQARQKYVLNGSVAFKNDTFNMDEYEEVNND